MVFVGCKKNTTAPPKKPADNRVAAKFSGNILKNEVKTTTRVTGNTWDQGDEVGMFAFKEGSRANSGLLCSNYKFNAKKNGELEEVTGLMYFPSGGEKVDFIAYHPYHSNLNLGTPSQWITFKPEHPLNKMECLWASANGQSEASPKVNFEFKRLQSSVTFILKATSEHEYTVDSDITLTDMPYKAFFDVVKGTLVASTETSGISDLKGLKYNRLYYLPPHEAKKHTTRSIVVTTREKKALSVPIKFDFESGKTHIITVFLGKDGYKLSLESTVVPFEDSGEITLKPIGLINNK
ncbi:hypothetical protein BN938_2157 [Mucinivorans hirudinis]|uniref:Fimbrillin family protein n=1 Tax=Mucinivorans hirudinis TaxID=1433126 RepID=A0A060R9E1_9BACT|nr:hypothetical protein BN938_2157 [Mucinivorans hirudinis]